MYFQRCHYVVLGLVLALQGCSSGAQLPTASEQSTSRRNGALTAPVAILTGAPSGQATDASLGVAVSGDSVVAYSYKLGLSASTDCTVLDGYSVFQPVAQKIVQSLNDTASGSVSLCVLGADITGRLQPLTSPTVARWTLAPLVANASGSGSETTGAGNSSGTSQAAAPSAPSPLTVSLALAPGQQQTADSLPVNYLVTFSEPVPRAYFAAASFSNLGSAVWGETSLVPQCSGTCGTTASVFLFSVKTLSQYGTILPLVAPGAAATAVGTGSLASETAAFDPASPLTVTAFRLSEPLVGLDTPANPTADSVIGAYGQSVASNYGYDAAHTGRFRYDSSSSSVIFERSPANPPGWSDMNFLPYDASLRHRLGNVVKFSTRIKTTVLATGNPAMCGLVLGFGAEDGAAPNAVSPLLGASLTLPGRNWATSVNSVHTARDFLRFNFYPIAPNEVFVIDAPGNSYSQTGTWQPWFSAYNWQASQNEFEPKVGASGIGNAGDYIEYVQTVELTPGSSVVKVTVQPTAASVDFAHWQTASVTWDYMAPLNNGNVAGQPSGLDLTGVTGPGQMTVAQFQDMVFSFGFHSNHSTKQCLYSELKVWENK